MLVGIIYYIVIKVFIFKKKKSIDIYKKLSKSISRGLQRVRPGYSAQTNKAHGLVQAGPISPLTDRQAEPNFVFVRPREKLEKFEFC